MSRAQRRAGNASNASSDEINAYNSHAYDLDWIGILRFAAPTLGLAVVLGGLIAMTMGGGCASKNPDLAGSSTSQPASDTPRASALDVGPTHPPTAVETPLRESVASTPPSTPQPSDSASSQPAAAVAAASTETTSTSAAGESSYVVQRGDTLFRIAKQKYGDGKLWTRITKANPGVTPASLKAGQKIIIP